MTKLDDLFVEDDNGTLSVPLPEDDVVTEIAEAEGYVNNAIPDTISDVDKQQTGKPGETVECEICGKKAKVRRDGYLGAHGKCEPKAQRGNRLETLPERKSPIKGRTRDFLVGVISWSVEESAAHTLARPFNADPAEVPTEMPDADLMIGVPLDIVWPEIPDAAHKFLDKLADNADVIECGIAWFEWMRVLGKWTREQREINKQRMEMGNGSQAAQRTGGQLLPFVPTAEG